MSDGGGSFSIAEEEGVVVEGGLAAGVLEGDVGAVVQVAGALSEPSTSIGSL